MDEPQDITQLIASSRDGSDAARDQLIAFVYQDLKRLASRQLLRERDDFTLSATALVNEAWLRLMGDQPPDMNDRAHFFALVATTMRRIAVDHARSRLAEKRGGDEVDLEFEDHLSAEEDRCQMIVEVSQLMDELKSSDPRLVQVIEYRFFVGMTESETAETLGVSRPTVSRDWERARKIMRNRLET